MSFAKVYSAQTTLLKAQIITIEVDISRGLHAFTIVGLPDKAVEESRDRVSTAIKHSGFASPKSKNQKVVISLAPADVKKEGPMFDLPIALAYLLASGEIQFETDKRLFLGELSLDGELRPIKGILPLVQKASEAGFHEVYVPHENAREAALIKDIAVFSAHTLTDVVAHLNQKQGNTVKQKTLTPEVHTTIAYQEPIYHVDMRDVRGQETAKRGLEIAAAGGHNVAMWGPPGTGKTMLAKAFASILPPLSFDDILEVTSIHSVAGTLVDTLLTHPPFRAPHHTSSYVSLVGGGAVPKPGELTLAHKGVLFLDEFPEFERRVIEALRQPLEERVVSVSRARGSAQFPAQVLLVAAMNPCPCGNWGSPNKQCSCMPHVLQNYQRKLSGPIVDRIDLWLEVGAVDHDKLSGTIEGETSAILRERIANARARQKERFQEKPGHTNSQMSVKDLEALGPLEPSVQKLLNESARKLDLSARSYHRVIKIARTIADLDASDTIQEAHMLEALQYRPRKFFSI